MRSCVLLLLALPARLRPTGHARAACLEPREVGQWTNVTPDTRGLVSLDLRFVCQDRLLNGAPYPPGPAWYVHAVGKCEPVDCDWREVGVQRLATAHIFAVYEQVVPRRDV